MLRCPTFASLPFSLTKCLGIGLGSTSKHQALSFPPRRSARHRPVIMASSVDAKLLKSTKFPPEFSQKVDMQKVNVEVMKK